ncbi:hypothetical protein CHUAL_005688 [Chamberlinius hualienensis]
MYRAAVLNNGKRIIRVVPRLNQGTCRHLFGRPWRTNEVDLFDEMNRHIREMERVVDRVFHSPFTSRFRPFDSCYSLTMPRFRNLPVESVDETGKLFRMTLDVSGSKPEDIKVTVRDGVVTIKAKTCTETEGGAKFSREAQWEYKLPKDVEEGTFQSKLSSDGYLTLEANRMVLPEKEIPVVQEKSAKPEKKE